MTRIFALAGALALLLALAAVGLARSQDTSVTPTKSGQLEPPAAQPGPQALEEAAVTIQRTFVSTSGNDANPCTRAAPCRGFAAAIANTTAGGEVVALDSGGYGPFTVGKAVTIAGAPGEHVALSSFMGTAIHVNAGPTDAVVLRNLYVTGLGGSTGIFFETGGTLQVESVVVEGFTSAGLNATAAGSNLLVRDSVFRRNGGDGILVFGALRTEISDTRADTNAGHGFFLRTGARGSIVRSVATRNGQTGFNFWFGALVTVADSIADSNGDAGASIEDGGTNVALRGVVLSNNAAAGARTVLGSVARVSGSSATGNAFGFQAITGSIFVTFGDNVVGGNTTDVHGTLTPAAKT